MPVSPVIRTVERRFADQFDDFDHFPHGAAGANQQVARSSAADAGVALSFPAFTLRAVMTDGDRQQLAELFGLHRVRDVLKRAALGEVERLANHARRLVEDDGNLAAFVVDLPQHLRGGSNPRSASAPGPRRWAAF